MNHEPTDNKISMTSYFAKGAGPQSAFDFKDLESSNVTALKQLSLENVSSMSLEKLSLTPNLTSLDIKSHDDIDLQPIAQLKSLQSLSLSGGNFETLAPL